MFTIEELTAGAFCERERASASGKHGRRINVLVVAATSLKTDHSLFTFMVFADLRIRLAQLICVTVRNSVIDKGQ